MNAQPERRKYIRITKSFVLSYYNIDAPEKKHAISQLKNISKGGMCFITTAPYKAKDRIGVELRTPYLADTTHLEGKVLESQEKVKNILYETRMEFDYLNPDAEFVLEKLIEYFVGNKEKQS